MADGQLGFIDTPLQGNRPMPGVTWCADNGCFSDRWDAGHWWRWLTGLPRDPVFAVAPDVVADWPATLDRFAVWEPLMHAEGFPVAVVAQDGATADVVPWASVEAVFIGGSTEWKLSPDAERIIAEANRRGVWAHVGRVNARRRLLWCATAGRLYGGRGADSCDGTLLVHGPDKHLQPLLRWLRETDTQTAFSFGGEL